MQFAETYLVLSAFLLIGIVVGYVTYLIFRISVNQQKFEWSGALSVITTLAGGGFLSYWSKPLNFAAYGIGFFIGFVIYWGFLQYRSLHPVRFQLGSQAISMPNASAGATLANASINEANEIEPASLRQRPGSPLRMPEEPEELIKKITDIRIPMDRRMRALLALRTGKHSEDILLTDSLRSDLGLCDMELLLFSAILLISFPMPSDSLHLDVVGDLISFVQGQQR